MANHMLIGLGGTGGRIVRSFRKEIRQHSRSEDPNGVATHGLAGGPLHLCALTGIDSVGLDIRGPFNEEEPYAHS